MSPIAVRAAIYSRSLSKRSSFQTQQLSVYRGLQSIHRQPRHLSQIAQQKNHDLRTRTRNIQYAFDPANIPAAKWASDPFSFLRPSAVASPSIQHVNLVMPSANNVPWPTSFPNSLQSKYWVEVEETARGFVLEILATRSEVKPEKYIDTITDAAVSLLINVAPMGNLSRMNILAKLYVFFIISDDAVDSGNKALMIPDSGALQQGNMPEYPVYNVLAREILSADASQGQRLLEGVMFWVSGAQRTPPSWFSTLEDYITYRMVDVGAYAVFRSVEFACDVSLSETDLEVVAHLRSLCEKHFLLTNDLYSYAKEAVAQQETGKGVLNAVQTVHLLMSTSVPLAKGIVRQMIWDVERQMHKEYKRLAQNATVPQLTYAQGLIVSVAGNMFYSATCARYARAIKGSELHR